VADDDEAAPPPTPVDMTSTVIGPPNGKVDESRVVTIRERRWFEARSHVERVTKKERVDMETVHVREGNECWDRKFFREDTVTENDTITEQRYEDYEFKVDWQEYFRWWQANLWAPPDVVHRPEITLQPGVQFGPDGTFELPRQKVDTVDGRSFPKPPDQPQKVGEGWATTQTPTDKPEKEVVLRGVAQYEDGPHQPCGEATDTTSTAIVGIEVVDVDTGQPVEGTLQGIAPTLPNTVKPVSPPTGPPVGRTGLRNAYMVSPGTEVKVIHTPPPGYVVDHNSTGSQPPGELKVTATGVEIYTFYDRKVPAGPQTPPPPWVKGATDSFKRWWKLLVGLLILIVLVIAIVALTSGGGDDKPEPTAAPTTDAPTSTTGEHVGLSKEDAARDYLAAADPVNSALSDFLPIADGWNDSTRAADAQSAAQPLADALQQAQQRLQELSTQYAPAHDALATELSAIDDTATDLQNLAGLNQTIDVPPWRASFDAHVAALAAASNALRTQLGLPPTSS
jgi:hypothetical protein